MESMMRKTSLVLAVLGITVHLEAAAMSVEERVASQCATCHGEKGQSVSPLFPSLAGQNREYMVKQLNDFKAGKRKSETMSPQVADLGQEEMAALAAYFSAQPAKQHRVSDEEIVPVGRYIYRKGNSWSGVPACASCHGEGLNKPIDPAYPKLAGQHSDYLLVALKAYQTDNNSKVGRGNPIMAGQAKQFTVAELKVMANYIGSLPSDLKTVPQSPLHKP